MDLQQRVASIQGTSVFVFQMGALPGSTGGLPVQMVVRSDDSYRNVFGVMSHLREEASKSGLFAVVDSDLAFDNPVVRVTVDRTKANALGIRMERIGNALNTLIGENYVNRFGYYGRSYDVIPQAVPLSRLTPDALKTYYMRDQNGHQVPLSALASVRVDVEPNRLPQFGQQNSATFQAILAKGVTMGDAVSFLKAKAAEFPPGYSYDWQSDSRQYVQEGNALIFAFLFALIAIYLVLSVQYNSFTDPVIILVSVPLSVFGALIPLALGVTTLNIYTEIGLITLIGLVSKHGILMVEFANEILHRDNVDRRTAIETAAAIRFRPIIMTTAAMVVGLAPLVIATGAGANSRFGLGTVIVVGMIVGTSMTLFVLPSVYTVIRPRRSKTV
ncbi:efflux RND transporter permease subunit [Brytella acorum]|uniref:Efflux RND transporter permease subunit n=1 Tax=Brytella acorum TaxID=2959299 RepID=A0AA35VA57_9PROT|nr:efflux RND transporter permease subunit [Brytella acorum]CAI9122323.1 efflux RND transporter permease subunit [Brytella acorum]